MTTTPQRVPLSASTVEAIRARYEHHASTAASAYIVSLCESHALLAAALAEAERAREEAQREAARFKDAGFNVAHELAAQRGTNARLSEENARLRQALEWIQPVTGDPVIERACDVALRGERGRE